MNICTLLSAAHDASGARRLAHAEALPEPVLPRAVRAMTGLSIMRMRTAARALVQAERQANEALDRLREAESGFARLRAQAAAHETAWRGGKANSGLLARHVLDTRAAQAGRNTLLATEAKKNRAHARCFEQARAHLEAARHACREANRRNETLQRWLHRLEQATDQA